jgi:hAT family C-terminal dimerisation region
LPSEREKLTEELDKFLAEPNEAEDINPYMWWASNQASYPSVTQVARSYRRVGERVYLKVWAGRFRQASLTALNPFSN